MNLGEETDRLNESFEQLEGALTALDFGVSASVNLAENIQESLSFRRTNSGWKLMIDRSSPEESVELVKTSRLLRILASDRVYDLFLALCGEKDRQLSEVSDAITKVEAVTRRVVELAKR